MDSVKDWIESAAVGGSGQKRPSRGIDRSERQRLFWERVASGAPTRRPRPSFSQQAVGTHQAAGAHQAADQATRPPARAAARKTVRRWWRNAEPSAITFLTVIVFGLGWVGVETAGLGEQEQHHPQRLQQHGEIFLRAQPNASAPIRAELWSSPFSEFSAAASFSNAGEAARERTEANGERNFDERRFFTAGVD